ncbi:hypothetical protein STAFG_5245 [Streptomyces afghaniensis 772]|uniref:Uncharacterized protein n=1 Tax=Streptomyces afghaniensis 772 TaxID=1283301 RepID=S4NH10_9ACTN|nr:hypothetical protein STAFG_5245 [Streptomyces afghaniensis 772]
MVAVLRDCSDHVVSARARATSFPTRVRGFL